MTKRVEDMTPIEQMRHWIDIVDGKIVPKDGNEIESVTESGDQQKMTIVIKKKPPDA